MLPTYVVWGETLTVIIAVLKWYPMSVYMIYDYCQVIIGHVTLSWILIIFPWLPYHFVLVIYMAHDFCFIESQYQNTFAALE